MSFLIKDDELLEKYNEIWEKVKNGIRKKFKSKRVYNEKYLKSKIKLYIGKINIIFTMLKYQEKVLSSFG